MNMHAGTGERVHARAEVEVAGEQAFCDSAGVLFLPQFRALVVSDLHLEKGASHARRGRLIPPYDSAATLARLGAAVDRYAPAIVISLGDSFHDRDASRFMPEPFRNALAAMMAGRDWFWVTGNHDPLPPAGLGGFSVSEISLGGLVFRHEPTEGACAGEIAGHLHPGARVVRRGRSVRRPCFATDGARMVMPAFGAYTGTLNVLDGAYRTLFRREALTAYLLGPSRIHAIAGRALSAG